MLCDIYTMYRPTGPLRSVVTFIQHSITLFSRGWLSTETQLLLWGGGETWLCLGGFCEAGKGLKFYF